MKSSIRLSSYTFNIDTRKQAEMSENSADVCVNQLAFILLVTSKGQY